MAEKPGGKGGGKKAPPPKVTNMDAATRLIMILLILAVIGAIVGAMTSRVGSIGESKGIFDVLRRLFGSFDWLEAFIERIKVPFLWISGVVSVLAASGAFYARREHAKLTKNKEEEIALLEAKLAGANESNRNDRWEHVLQLVSNENPGDWRVAIVEADIMLDSLLIAMGHHGETLGDRLKGIEKSDFQTLDLAWEAHKIRNRIAHSGSDFILTHREAKRVIDLFRQVFEEFDYI